MIFDMVIVLQVSDLAKKSEFKKVNFCVGWDFDLKAWVWASSSNQTRNSAMCLKSIVEKLLFLT